jgi:two-component system, OmpR family, osmolarity sensor histidine kinase EnvZ
MSGADRRASEAMIEDIGEIDGIIGQFLDFARGENEDKAPHDIDALVQELGEHYQRLGRKLSVAANAGATFAFARMSVRRAIANLVDNALRYAGEPIEIESMTTPEGVAVEVRDRGPGIPASEVERMKRPFTRLDDARSGASGSGLGLAIVERVARAHGGSLELLPRPGGGLTARLVLNRGQSPISKP